jgi:DNA-binding NtrC family response regulator
MEIFLKRPWVGNVREMENVIIEGILFSTTDEITPKDIHFNEILPEDPHMENPFQELPYKEAKEQTLQHFNAEYIGNLLITNQGNVTQAARSCGLERQALQQIMRRYNIKADTFRKK